MKTPIFITSIEKANTVINKALLILAGCSVVTMMLVIFGNIVSRIVWKPIQGVSEIAGWLAAISISLALGYTQSEKGHVNIEIVVEKMGTNWQKVVKCINYLLSAVFFGIVFWQLIKYGYTMQIAERRSSELGIIFYPIVYIICLGFLGLFMTLVIQIIKLPFEVEEADES